jgi:hypothetical protein
MTVTIALCALFVAIIGLAMNFARTPPEEARVNLARWLARLPRWDRGKAYTAIFARSLVGRVLLGVLFAGALVILFWPQGDPSQMTVASTRLATDPPPDDFGVNVYTQNIGKKWAKAVRKRSAFISVPPSHDATGELNDASLVLLSGLKNTREPPTNFDIPVGGKKYWTAFGSKQSYDDNKQGRNDS